MIHTHLFLDDTELFRRLNLERRHTPMTEVAEYSDGISNQMIPAPFVFRDAAGQFRMIYPANLVAGEKRLHYFVAKSEDGIHFRPDAEAAEKLGLTSPAAPQQCMEDLTPGSEIFDIFEDPAAEPEARYKMLYALYLHEEKRVDDRLRISPDGIHWQELPTVHWHSRGSEPVGSVTPNPFRTGEHLILTRPDWGDRRIALVRTSDWENFSAPQLVMAPDGADEPMAEHYGVRAFPCAGMLLGFLMVYHTHDCESLHHKFYGGVIRNELVYSRNGIYWQRLDRKTFWGSEHNMFWPGTVRRDGDDLILYANATSSEHGDFTPDRFCGSVRIYRTRRDRFVSLAVGQGVEAGTLALRQCVFHGGELHWNLRAEEATCAVYETHDMNGKDLKLLRSHEDCLPFSGDSTDWVVRWKSHDSLNDLQGKLVVFELRMKRGEVWSCSGDFVRLGTTEAFRYDRFHILPTRRGF